MCAMSVVPQTETGQQREEVTVQATRISLWTGLGLCMALLFCVSSPTVNAETIQIDFTGLDILLDGIDGLEGVHIVDAKDDNTDRALDVNEADALSTVEFKVDDTTYRDLDYVYADFYVKDVSEIPAEGGIVYSAGNGNTFGLDLFGTTDGAVAWKLQLDIDKLRVLYDEDPDIGEPIGIMASARATVFDQDLPFGLADIDTSQRVSISISCSNVWDVADDDTYLTGFSASGTGTVKAILVPEPSALMGLLMGALGLVATGWVRRRWRQ
jgi:hypothetical protein